MLYTQPQFIPAYIFILFIILVCIHNKKTYKVTPGGQKAFEVLFRKHYLSYLTAILNRYHKKCLMLIYIHITHFLKCLLTSSAVLSTLSASDLYQQQSFKRGSFLSSPFESHLDLHTFKDSIPLREACPSPHWWSQSPWRQRCHDKEPELLVAWWWHVCCDDSILYGPYTSINYQQICIYGKPSQHLLFLTQPMTWAFWVYACIFYLENSSVLLTDEINSRIHPAVKWKCNHGGVQKYD